MSQPIRQEQPLTFAYSELEATRIIEQSRCSNAFLQPAADTSIFKEYEKEKRKLIGLDLHAATLTIINKAGYQEREIGESEKQIVELDRNLRQHVQTEDQQLQLQRIESNLAKHRSEIEERKRSKFRRDELDYSSGCIYNWQRETGGHRDPGGQPRPQWRRHQWETRRQRARETGYSNTDTSTDGRQPRGMDGRDEQALGYRDSDSSRDGSQTDLCTARATTPSPSFLDAGPRQYTRQKGEGADGTNVPWYRRRQPERKARWTRRT
ncbi:hypothetical protein XELAEV_18012927mg [Xenopus laevis]|uniref:Uncharacterized protein n=1 Tax=Xenopus laevis TaxID=8355 RepID=A0A974DP10_XENLA|nr:hypothetical protein XELAEV_18012927mg [Xenopus laevis]